MELNHSFDPAVSTMVSVKSDARRVCRRLLCQRHRRFRNVAVENGRLRRFCGLGFLGVRCSASSSRRIAPKDGLTSVRELVAGSPSEYENTTFVSSTF
ncbi:hypothetical protein CRE_05163 [Caenorhabditis remanei]|uniref:Uncharacterized protein n=1 Tax=Caenorhabditis remanei TaxID=31234 RepID=E3N6E2_CAERE|nr:hypothetical protein CRE_05163 [Caenorhabditis remanei]